jgi:hypothetical protein
MLASAEGRKRSRHQVSTAASRAIGKASQSPTVRPISSAAPLAAPNIAHTSITQPGRQRSRSWSRWRR